MSGVPSSSHRGQPKWDRDHVRPRGIPGPTSEEVEARLAEVVKPATFAVAEQYRRYGLRWRVLTLPVMVALLLALIWRQVPSVRTLATLLTRERMVWEPPRQVSQQALDLRLRCLPAALMGEVLAATLPPLQARAAARERPRPPAVARALDRFGRVWVVDGTTLEHVFQKVGLRRDAADRTKTAPSGGKCVAVLDLASHLPERIWVGDAPTANDKRWLPALRELLAVPASEDAAAATPPPVPTRGLLVFDGGFYSFAFFDWLTDHGVGFLTRARADAAFEVERVLYTSPTARDRIIRLGQYRSNRCAHAVRLVEVQIGGAWRTYLTNVLDPTALSLPDVVDLYSRRWDIESAFLLVKRLARPQLPLDWRLQRHRHAGLGHLAVLRCPRRPRRRCRRHPRRPPRTHLPRDGLPRPLLLLLSCRSRRGPRSRRLPRRPDRPRHPQIKTPQTGSPTP
jgi:hypothetical protein